MNLIKFIVSLTRGYLDVGSRTHGRDTFLCADKEKYPKEIRPMPLVSCALTVLLGFARKDIPVLLAKCGILAAPLWAIPDKTASARRGITGMGANFGVVDVNKM